MQFAPPLEPGTNPSTHASSLAQLAFTFANMHDSDAAWMRYNAFFQACEQGDLDTARQLFEHGDPVMTNSLRRTCLSATCEHGHQHVLEWLCMVWPVADDVEMLYRAWRGAGVCGDTNMVDYLHTTFPLAPDATMKCASAALRAACEHGHEDMARHVASMVQLSVETSCMDICEAWYGACLRGHVDLVQFLHLQWPLTSTINEANSWDFPDDGMLQASEECPPERQIHRHLSTALHNACGSGNMELIEWLIDTYDLDESHVRYDNTQTVCRACYNGHVQVVRWLCETYDLTLADIRGYNNTAFRNAVNSGCMDVIVYLQEHFPSDATMVPYFYGHDLLRHALVKGRLDVARWFIDTFELSAEFVRDTGREAFLEGCRQGNVPMLQHVHDVCHFGREDVFTEDGQALRAACGQGHVAVLEWMCATFGTVTPGLYNPAYALLDIACRNGHLAMVQWLCFRAPSFDVYPKWYYKYALETARTRHHTHVADWLQQLYKLA